MPPRPGCRRSGRRQLRRLRGGRRERRLGRGGHRHLRRPRLCGLPDRLAPHHAAPAADPLHLAERAPRLRTSSPQPRKRSTSGDEMFNRPAAPRARRWFTGVALAATVVAAPTAAAAPDPATSWHGRAIERPEPARSVAQPGWPRGWSAGPVATGTGSIRASRRVRAVQRELHARGYRVGRVDGRFGPRTRGAVSWFQIKHGLEPTGRGRRGHARRAPHAPRPAHHAHAHRRTHADPDTGGDPRRSSRASLVQPGRRRPAAAHARHDAGADRALLAPEPAGSPRRPAPPAGDLPHRARLHRGRPGHRRRARAGRRHHGRDRRVVRRSRLAPGARDPRRATATRTTGPGSRT